MKPILIFFLCFIFSLTLFGQTKTVSKDTINLKGRIFTFDGRPVPGLGVSSRQTDPRFEPYHMLTKTDENGAFEFNGAMPYDTLTISSLNYGSLNYYNKGSRVMIILLPEEKITDITASGPIEINAVRTKPKTIPEITFSPAGGSPPFLLIQKPEFPGGTDKFISFIKQHVHYPASAVQNNIEGTVEIAFTVEKNGSLNDFIILKGIGYGCDQEVLKAASKSPMWMPGILNGTTAAITFSVSVKFSLTDK